MKVHANVQQARWHEHSAHLLSLNLLFYFLEGCSHTYVSLNDL